MSEPASKAAVKMYATGTCPYCIRAEQLLLSKGVERFEKIRVDLHPERRSEMVALSGRRTVPQIFIGDSHVGGCDDLHDLERAGKLEALLNNP